MALLHASHPGECPDCGFELVVLVDKTTACHTCETQQIVDVVNGKLYLRDVPLKALYPNRAARRRAGL